jgi:hypothetical protein
VPRIIEIPHLRSWEFPTLGAAGERGRSAAMAAHAVAGLPARHAVSATANGFPPVGGRRDMLGERRFRRSRPGCPRFDPTALPRSGLAVASRPITAACGRSGAVRRRLREVNQGRVALANSDVSSQSRKSGVSQIAYGLM